MPYLLLGVLLVLGCVAGAVVVGIQLGQRKPVLVLAHPVSVGQEISAQDVREVSLSVDSSLELVPAGSLPALEGRPFAYSLPAGSVLTKSAVGEARVPAAGKAVAAVGLKAGQFPPGLKPGNQVRVVTAPSDSGAADAGTGASSSSRSESSWRGTVTDVQTAKDDQRTVISLEMDEGDARSVAAASTGEISVVMVGGGGG